LAVIRVFLVDDHEVIREGLKHMLASQEDIQVIGEAANGESAVVQAQKLQPDVVLMDIKMPGMDGIMATRRIREKIPDVHIIILTLYNHDYVTQAIEAGASGYILKDSSREQLVQAIRDANLGYTPMASSITRDFLTEITNSNQTNRGYTISKRQRQVLRLVAAGLSNKSIGDRLCLSGATIKKEMTHIFNTLGVSDRAQAVSEGMKRNLI